MLNEFITVYLNDILVYSETQQEHLMHLRKVFKRIKNSKLGCKLKKCEFGKDYIKYLQSQNWIWDCSSWTPPRLLLLVLGLPQACVKEL